MIEALTARQPTRVISSKGEPLLTAREDQVAGLVAEGMGNREIAQRLRIKENTVKKSLLRIYDKLGVCNRVELVLYVLTHRGTITEPSELREVVAAHGDGGQKTAFPVQTA